MKLLRGLALLSTLLAAGAPAAHATTAQDLADFEARVQYAFFTEDGNLLTSLVRGAAKPESALDRYHLAHAHYRLAQVVGARDRKAAAAAADECIRLLDKAMKEQAKFAEAHALQGACYSTLASLRSYKAMVLGPLAARQVEQALEIAPQNPRAVLVDAQGLRDRPAMFGGDKDKAFERFRRAAQLFDAPAAIPAGSPTWGRAEAWLALGRQYAERSDIVNARDAFERALGVAPDYAAARRALAALQQ